MTEISDSQLNKPTNITPERQAIERAEDRGARNAERRIVEWLRAEPNRYKEGHWNQIYALAIERGDHRG